MEVTTVLEIIKRAADRGLDPKATAALVEITAAVLDGEAPLVERKRGRKRGRPAARRTRRKKRKYVRKQAAETNDANGASDASADAPAKRANAGEGVTSTVFSKSSARAEKWTQGQLASHLTGMLRGELLAAAHKTGVSEPAIERSLARLGVIAWNELVAGSRQTMLRLP